LYDLEGDPREQRNLALDDPERLERWERRLQALVDALPQPGPTGPGRAIDEQTRRALEELGYLE
jgi:hypothetical protein